MILFDSKYLKNVFSNYNNLSFIDKYYSISDNSIVNIYIINYISIFKKSKNKNFLRKIKYIVDKLEFSLKVNFKEFKCVKKWEDLLFAYISFFIIRELLNSNNEIDFETNKFNSSDDVINKMCHNFNYFFIWIEIILKKQININNKDIRIIFWNCIILLIDSGKINEKRVFKSNKTLIFYSLSSSLTKKFFEINISFDKFLLYKRSSNEVYIYNYHFSNIFKVYKENPSSGYIFEANLNNIENERLLSNLCDNWIYIDRTKLSSILHDLMSYYNIENLDLEEKYELLINDMRNSIKESDKFRLQEVSKVISQYQNIIRLKKIIEIKELDNNKVYLPFRFDFRGRLYFLSDISPTYYREIRFCMNKGVYKCIKKDTKFHILEILINNELDKYVNIIDLWKLYSFSEKNILIKYSIIWILVSIAEVNKVKLGKEINFEIFVKEGIKIVESYFSNYKSIKDIYDIYDLIKIKYYISILDEINKDIYVSWLISKDATASCYQHLIKILGSKDSESLKWCNLKSLDTWFDTYSYIIENFNKKIKSECLSIDDISKIFSRKTLKRVIMTENYGASMRTCIKYFTSSFSFEKYTLEQQKEIISIFKLFYNYLTTDNSILRKSSSEIVEYFSNVLNSDGNIISTLKDDSKIYHIYYKHNIKQIEIYLYNKRYTKQERLLTSTIDMKKIKNAIRANYVQSIDAALVRWYLCEIRGITIHDCFMIDYLNTTFLIAKLNEGMRLVFHDLELASDVELSKIFSLFIVL